MAIRFIGMTLFLALSLLLLETIVVLGDIGTATSYNPPYTPTRCNGNRQDQFPAGNLFVSVSEGLWDNGAACGRRYRLSCLSGNNRPCKGDTIDVKRLDGGSEDDSNTTFSTHFIYSITFSFSILSLLTAQHGKNECAVSSKDGGRASVAVAAVASLRQPCFLANRAEQWWLGNSCDGRPPTTSTTLVYPLGG
nr:EG45-like domain containing protein [Ipomoea batatas]